MIIETDQFTNLQLSKKLKEIGLKQDSLFYWEYISDSCYDIKYRPYCICLLNSGFYKHYSAFTPQELFEFIPNNINNGSNEFNYFRFHLCRYFNYEENKLIFILNYQCIDIKIEGEIPILLPSLLKNNISDPILSNALAKLIIKLDELKLIKI